MSVPVRQLVIMVVNRLVLRARLVVLGLFRARSRAPEIPLPSAVGADRREGHEPLEVGGLAGRARRRGRGEHQQLESVLALTAFVFVDWHLAYLKPYPTVVKVRFSVWRGVT